MSRSAASWHPDELDQLDEAITALLAGSHLSAIREARERYVYHLGQSGEAGAEALIELQQQRETGRREELTH